MFDSQTMQIQGTTATDLFSPWFPRGGDYGIFTMEMTSKGASAGTLTLTARLYHKNAAETGDGTEVPGAISSLALSSTGRTFFDYKNGGGTTPFFQGFKELVRYKFSLTGSGTTNTSWVTFRMLPVTWYDKV